MISLYDIFNRRISFFFPGSNRNLVGDRSRTYLLPRCTSRKHADLACISPETVRPSIY